MFQTKYVSREAFDLHVKRLHFPPLQIKSMCCDVTCVNYIVFHTCDPGGVKLQGCRAAARCDLSVPISNLSIRRAFDPQSGWTVSCHMLREAGATFWIL